MEKITIHPTVAGEAREASAWYDKQQAELGSKFLDAIESAIRSLEFNPLR